MSQDDRDLGPDVPAQSTEKSAAPASDASGSEAELTMAAKIGVALDTLAIELRTLESELHDVRGRGRLIAEMLFGDIPEPEEPEGHATAPRRLGLEGWLLDRIDRLTLFARAIQQEMCAHHGGLCDITARLGEPGEDGDPDNG